MKPFSLACLSTLAALAWPTFSARALDPSLFNDGFAPLTPALAQFFTDLEAIPAGSTVTDAQHATLLADLTALPPGPAAPDAATLDQLATDFGAVAVAGLVDDDLEYQLAMDFDVDADDPDSWLAYVQNDVQFALNPPAPYDPTLDPGLPYDPTLGPGLPYDPLILTTASVPKPGVVMASDFVLLHDVYDTTRDQSPLRYSGHIRLKTRTPSGGATAPTLTLSALGLPIDGTYTLSTVRRSDHAQIVLGQFVPQTFVPPGVGGGTITLAYTPWTTLNTRVRFKLGAGGSAALPDGFDVNDVQSLTVTNAAGRTRLKQKLAAPNRVRHSSAVLLRLGSPASRAMAGRVTAAHKVDFGSTANDVLAVLAHGLPASTPVTVFVDGVKMGTQSTNSGGRLRMVQRSLSGDAYRDAQNDNPLPTGTNLSTAHTATVVDAAGNVLLSGSL